MQSAAGEKPFSAAVNLLFGSPMNMTTAKPADRPGWSLVWLPWLAVLAVLFCVGAVRVHLLDVPLERDEGEYAYAGQLILQGIPPCELAYNMKLPGTYFAYAAGLAVFGQTTAGVHLTLLAVNSLTCLFLFLFGRQLAGPVAGVAACAAYAVLSLSPAVLGLAGHATQFVVLFAVPGAWALWSALATGRRWLFVLAGGLFGVAFMMKQPGLCFGLFGRPGHRGAGDPRRRPFETLALVAPFRLWPGAGSALCFVLPRGLGPGGFPAVLVLDFSLRRPLRRGDDPGRWRPQFGGVCDEHLLGLCRV